MTLETENKTVKLGGYTYLADLAADYEDEAQETLVVAPEFHGVLMGFTGTRKIGDEKIYSDKYSSPGFPKQNLESFKMIPLMVNALYRMAYLEKYSGENNPPDCQSFDGVKPVQPLQYNGTQITHCAGCPVYQAFGNDPGCHTRPLIVGLAWFPEHNNLLVPIRKAIPGKSMKAANALARQLSMSVKLEGDKPVKLPVYTRIVEVSVLDLPTNSGTWPTWNFNVSTTEFTPADILSEVKKAGESAQMFLQSKSTTAVLTGAEPVASLPGETVITEEETEY